MEYWDAYSAFIKNYNDMKNDSTIGGDKYFHSKANCQAGQLYQPLQALLIDTMREGSDFLFNNPIRKKLPLDINLQDCIDDYKANLYGLGKGLRHPLMDCRDLVNKYRVNGINEKY